MARDFGLLGMWAHDAWVNWLLLALATPVQFYVGGDYYVGGFKSLRNGSANMDVLVALGSSAAYFYSHQRCCCFPASAATSTSRPSALIITLIKLGKLLEARAKGRTSEAIKKLMGLRPKTARVVRDGVRSRRADRSRCELGDVVIVRPGEQIPVDGVVRRRPLGGRRVDAHRREPAGRQEAGRRGDRRRRSTSRACSSSRRPASAPRRSWRRSSAWWKRRRAPRRRSSGWPTGCRASSCRR